MTKLAQDRINFIELLHEAFLLRKGHGAFAFISIKEAIILFEVHLDSDEPVDLLINRFVRSV